MKIVVSAQVDAPLADVWSAYTTPADIVNWNSASDDWCTRWATVDLRVGGEFCARMEARDGSVGFDFTGTYSVVEPMTLIEYHCWDRHVRVDFEAQEAAAVVVRVSFDPEDENPLELQRQGWQAILDNFARYVAAKS
ncbi:SRPBCC domain-containing protein [Parathalassolituus penaei]|uniref:SRPBCC domain-containing protein n=1 Tax=Parathalassolituus penaei TaxID=2997323 RepID=A0A9X3EI07_9GAMM|nr:SRPBCC domain-containing protein [Parathalassolituus penaei]MCY0964606.1 SRPBCC domain-containing protein [Parathalassolituus penaei]